MNDEMKRLEEWVAPLLKQMEPAERRKLARKVSQKLATSQRNRIRDQRNPDGSPFEPRKPQARHQAGMIKRSAMFSKIRQAKYLKAQATPGSIIVGFVGRVARIAEVHQQGLRDRTRPRGPMAQYPRRELLGLTDADILMIQDELLEHFAPK